MAFIRKIKASFVTQDLEDYVGELTYLFHDVVTGEIRISNGQPGGQAIAFSGTPPPISPPPGGGGSSFLDGGDAFSVYTSDQLINGGNA